MLFNRYAYANNNPNSYVDPDGRDAININYVGYRVDTGLGFRAPLGHGGVVLVDETSGHTEYYEYGRYSPDGKGIVGAGLPAKQGNVRRVPIPDVEIGDDGRPTPGSLKNLYSYLKSYVGKDAEVDADYEDDADFKKMKDYVNSVANDPNRESYNFFNCNCFSFSDDVIQSGRSGGGGFIESIRNYFSSDGEDE